MINLRRTFWKENVFSISYRWGTDVPLFTNILALFNPISSGKNLNILQVDLGASASGNISIISQLILFTNISGATDLTSNIVKYNPNAPNSVANIFGGGVLTLDKIIDRKTINFNGLPSQSIDFKQEFELIPGNGICVVHESESSGNIYLPWVTYHWFE